MGYNFGLFLQILNVTNSTGIKLIEMQRTIPYRKLIIAFKS